MKRRSFLIMLGLAPIVPSAAKMAEASIETRPILANPIKARSLVLTDFSLQFDEFGNPFRAKTTAELIVVHAITADRICCPSCTINHGEKLGGWIL